MTHPESGIVPECAGLLEPDRLAASVAGSLGSIDFQSVAAEYLDLVVSTSTELGRPGPEYRLHPHLVLITTAPVFLPSSEHL